VITDESMPGMSGAELIRKVRKIRPAIPILLVSGYLGTAVVRRAREAGADAVLKKPLSSRELASSLGGLLNAPSSGRRVPTANFVEAKGRRRRAGSPVRAHAKRRP
jgi:CheY-like chemotaxis protein